MQVAREYPKYTIGDKVKFVSRGVGCTGRTGQVWDIEYRASVNPGQGMQISRVKVWFGADEFTGWWSADAVRLA